MIQKSVLMSDIDMVDYKSMTPYETAMLKSLKAICEVLIDIRFVLNKGQE